MTSPQSISNDPKIPRSIYAKKLLEFPEFAFGEQAAFGHQGRWADFFRHRIGPAFNGRIIFEIGCFDAVYLCSIAAKHPETGFVGLDWKCKAVFEGAQRIDGLGLRNIALLRGRGQDIGKIFAAGEVSEIWLFHPDPCDKPIELKNRLMADPFLIDVHHVLHDRTSVLAMKTDHPGYFQWVVALFGLPEPQWIRVPKARDLTRCENLPASSKAVKSRFDVTMTSPNFWHDPAAIAHTAGRYFSGEITLFENRFIKKRLPIYYMEIRKK